MLTRDPDGNDVYAADMHRSYLTLEQVRLQHGPVVPITDADRQALFNLLAAAKRKAVYSVASIRRGPAEEHQTELADLDLVAVGQHR